MLLKERYEVQDKIGAGTYGSVHKAFDHKTQTLVAIKFLNDASTFDIFHKEARQLYDQINNRFVVKLLDHDLYSEKPFIVLEYCLGGSLRSWVGQENPWQQIANALSCATSGLSEIHRLNGFHRDIKPDNLLITRDSETRLQVIKLGDLGLARIPTAGTMTYSPGGTRNYMAPEVLEAMLNPNHVSYQYEPSADVYSLGITALELLTGSTSLQELEKINKSKSPDGFVDLIKRMCSKKAIARPNTESIAKELSQLLAPPAAPKQITQTAQQARQPDNTGAVIAGIGLGALALIGLAALLDDKKEWDPDAQRYRGSDGKFRPK